MTGRYALVIGNSEYHDATLSRLKTPEADARALADALRDPAIGGFDDVQELINQDEGNIRRAISAFFTEKKPDDLLMLYFSGHGVLDPQGRLFLAVKDTQRSLLKATAIPASFVSENMDDCRSKRQVLVLDCCHSGAFAKGTKGDAPAITQSTFAGSGYGRVVLTASDSTQYALEGDQVIEQASLSLFTHYLLDGLTSGEADLAQDGLITLDEWYDYAYDRVRSETPDQTPRKWVYNQQGDLVIARNPRPAEIKPAELPDRLRVRLKSEYKPDRLEAIQELESLLKGEDLALALSAQAALEGLAAADDSLAVRSLASQVLAGYPAWLEHKQAEAERIAWEKAEGERREREKAEAERLALEKAEQERLEKEAAETRRLAREKAKQERLAKQKAAAENAAAERVALEQAQRQAEAERLAMEKAEAERVALEQAQRQAEAERLASEKAEAERVALEQARRQAEAERLAREKAEAERLAREKAEAERVALEQAQRQAELERLAKEQAEAERLANEKAEAERVALEQARRQAEAERLAREKAAAENAAAERVAKEQVEQERLRRWNGLYEKASAAAGVSRWDEAQRLFTQLEREAPGYRDTAAQLSRIAHELAQAPRAPSSTVTGTVQAGAAAPAWAAWKPALAIGLGWGFLSLVEGFLLLVNEGPVNLLYGLIPGAILGGSILLSFQYSHHTLQRRAKISLMALWALGVFLMMWIYYPRFDYSTDAFVLGVLEGIVFKYGGWQTLSWFFAGMFLATAILLERAVAARTSKDTLLIFAGWAVGFTLTIPFTGWAYETYGDYSVAFWVVCIVLHFFTGAIGGGWTHRVLRRVTPSRAGKIVEARGLPKEQAGEIAHRSVLRWKPMLTVALGWGFLLLVEGFLFLGYHGPVNLLYGLIPGAILGGSLLLSFQYTSLTLPRGAKIALMALWALGMSGMMLIYYPRFDYSTEPFVLGVLEGNVFKFGGWQTLSWFFAGLFLGTAFLLERATAARISKDALLIFAGWAVGFTLTIPLTGWAYETYGDYSAAFWVVCIVLHFFAGAIGGGWTHWILGRTAPRPVDQLAQARDTVREGAGIQQPAALPSYGKAIGYHLLLGFGLFKVKPQLKRKWLYPAAAIVAILDYFLAISDVHPFHDAFGQYLFIIALSIYIIGFIDTILTLRDHTGSKTPKE